MDPHSAAALAAPPKSTLDFTLAECEEFEELQRRTQALFADMADASLEEQQRLGDLAWNKMKQPASALPADVPRSLRNLGRFYERRQARHIRAVKPRSGQRQREHRPAATRRVGSSSSTSSSDPGSDSDESEPPHGRPCAAPWCSHVVYGSRQTYCGTERCTRARAAERQRKHRHGDDLNALERELLADARIAGYVGSAAFAEPGDEHSQTFLWKYGLADGDDPGEFYALTACRRVCRCNGHHIDGGAVGCLKCGMSRVSRAEVA
jgi:hypothetical protein